VPEAESRSTALRVLMVEDSEDDAVRILRMLKAGGYAVVHERVASAFGMRSALDRSTWDIVISDCRMPGFDGLSALAQLRERDPELPFIVVSGTIGEDAAVAMMKAGASDYVMKTNLARLAPAVGRELHDARLRQEHRLAREALRESEAGLHRAQVMAQLAHVITGPDGNFESWSETLPTLMRISPARMPTNTREWLDLMPAGDRENLRAVIIKAGETGLRAQIEYRLQRGDGALVCIRHVIEPLRSLNEATAPGRWFNTLQDVTVQRDIEEAVRKSEQRFRDMAENIREVFWLTDPAKNEILYVSPAYEEIWGRSAKAVYATPAEWIDAIHPEDRNAVRQAAHKQAGGDYDLEYRITRPDGSIRWIRDRAFPVLDGDRNVVRIAGVAADITERKEAEEKIKRLNRVYAVLSGINMLIVRTRDRNELYNEACRIAVDHGGFVMAWIGIVDREAGLVKPMASAGDVRDFFDSAPLAVLEGKPGGHGLVGRAIREMKPVISQDAGKDPQRLMKKQLAERGINSLAVLPLIIGGEAIGVLALYAAEPGVFDEAEMRLLLELVGDIAFGLEHIQKSEKIDYLAYYDEVTGLANRTLFLERVGQKLLAAGASHRKVAVFALDIQRFQAVNDALGRPAGDSLLKQIAERLRAAGNAETQVARFGGEHFFIMSPEAQTEQELARLIHTRFIECFDVPFRLGGSEVTVSAKVGVAVFPGDGADAETLARNAVAALEKAKGSGESYLFYTQEMTTRVAENLAMENKLRQAIENEEFVLHYQPKVDLGSRSIVGVEALIRWQSPALGLVPPLKFIPLLEETGLILQVGAWALKRAALAHRGWVEEGLAAPRVAVNVSQIQLRRRDFVDVVEAALREGLAPTGIDLEITESLIMEDMRGNVEKLKQLRALGIRIAIDDFGTGYSSLAYLAKLPVSTLKIDRTFISTMLDDPDSATLVQTMISLAHSLRLKVVAEGVETEDQAKMLRLLRCDEMQGYLFSKPLPLEAITALLAKKSATLQPA
jgi:diguanylate cyclase (GGDEF)-like protein/PAS domain S-box-containing protein